MRFNLIEAFNQISREIYKSIRKPLPKQVAHSLPSKKEKVKKKEERNKPWKRNHSVE